MTICLTGLRLTLEQGPAAAVDQALTRLALPEGCVVSARLARRSVDARRGKIGFVCAVAVTLTEQGAALLKGRSDLTYTVERTEALDFPTGEQPLEHRPVIAGFGPAGMFAALLLAQKGYRPLVLERGEPLSRRAVAVERFWKGGELEPRANVQFGEGGAGAFSDGKLTTRINDPLCRHVLTELVRLGAPEDILTAARPHVGTDRLRGVVTRLRAEIEALGGEVRFCTALTGLTAQSGRLQAVATEQGPLPVQALIAAVGHSARDTFEQLSQSGVVLIAKSFSVGARIEHRQADLDRALYGAFAGHPNLPPSEYQLSHREGERAAYTFCMCPGGMVVAAASGEGQVVTNGMSYHSRALPNGNSALAVSVGPDDFGPGWRDGIELQRRLEGAAFAAGGGDFTAPSMTVGALLGRPARNPVDPSYPRGVREADLAALLPAPVADLLRRSLPILGRRLAGFDSPDARLTGLETRTSSAARMPRSGDLLCADGIDGFYPCGEGAGYAGGIMSAAVDGLRCAGAVLARFAPPADNAL